LFDLLLLGCDQILAGRIGRRWIGDGLVDRLGVAWLIGGGLPGWRG
jgi:hypothetical protein